MATRSPVSLNSLQRLPLILRIRRYREAWVTKISLRPGQCVTPRLGNVFSVGQLREVCCGPMFQLIRDACRRLLQREPPPDVNKQVVDICRRCVQEVNPKLDEVS